MNTTREQARNKISKKTTGQKLHQCLSRLMALYTCLYVQVYSS